MVLIVRDLTSAPILIPIVRQHLWHKVSFFFNGFRDLTVYCLIILVPRCLLSPFLDFLHDFCKFWVGADEVLDTTSISRLLRRNCITQALVFVDKFDGAAIMHIFALSCLGSLLFLHFVVLLMSYLVELPNNQFCFLVDDGTIGGTLFASILTAQVGLIQDFSLHVRELFHHFVKHILLKPQSVELCWGFERV